MTRERAKNAYRRVHDWEHRRSEARNAAILVPYFGGCGCRMGNCLAAYESGKPERNVVRGLNSVELARLAKRYNYQQRQDWDKLNRLANAFARYF